ISVRPHKRNHDRIIEERNPQRNEATRRNLARKWHLRRRLHGRGRNRRDAHPQIRRGIGKSLRRTHQPLRLWQLVQVSALCVSHGRRKRGLWNCRRHRWWIGHISLPWSPFICNDKQGSYSEYVSLNAITGIFPMPDDVPIEDCASFMVNPYTAVGILDTAQQAGSTKAIVHTAAASQLGQMLNKLAPMKGMEIINVVRRQEQKELLEKLGAKHIIVTSGEDDEVWKAELKEKVKELGATCAFDAVSGDMTGHLMDVMPSKGIVHLYGGLAGRANGINPSDLIYRKKQLKSFFLTSWIQSGGTMKMVPRMLSASKTVNSGLKSPDGWCCSQFQDTTLEKAHEEIVKL
ncbi:hypothetical protein ACHAXR_000990, partial [Thalassiosira sp. AJA248-18]